MQKYQRTDFKLTLYMMRDCNLRCHYCFEGCKGKAAGASVYEMEMKTVEKSLSFFFDILKPPHFESIEVCIFGGEVLIKRDKMLQIAKRVDDYGQMKNMAVQKLIVTNGTLLTPENHQFLEENNIFYHISLDGDQKTHDANRFFASGNGSFDMIWRNEAQIRSGIESGLCGAVLMTITAEDVSRLYENTVFLVDKGFKKIQHNFTMESQYKWDDKVIEQIRDLLPEIICYAESKGAEVHPADSIRQRRRENWDVEQKELRCGLGTKRVSVEPDGRFLPCVRFSDKFGDLFEMGNVHSGRSNKQVFQFFMNLKENKRLKCHTCPAKHTCVTYCPYLAMEHGSVFDPPPVMCALNFAIHDAVDIAEKRIKKMKAKEEIYDKFNTGKPKQIISGSPADARKDIAQTAT